jgi:hypothetical protein
MKKAEKEIKKILDKYSTLYTDWIPADNGRVKKTINEDKKYLFLRALLDLTFLIEKSLNK